MTGQHIATHCKQSFSEYGWPETLISDNGPWQSSETFTNIMKEYIVNHITSPPHYQQSNGLAEKFGQIVKNLFHKAKEEGKDMSKCLMIYHNNPLSSSLQSPMQILQSRSAKSNLPMSNVARKQLGLDPEQLRSKYKNEHLPSHDLHLGHDVMFQDLTSKQSFLTTITSLCPEPRSYKITTKEGVTYRKAQAHLKPYSPHIRRVKMNSVNHNLVICGQLNLIASSIIQFDSQTQSYSRPKRDIKPPVKLNL